MPFDKIKANIISYTNFGLLVVAMAISITIFILALLDNNSYSTSDSFETSVDNFVGPVVNSSSKSSIYTAEKFGEPFNITADVITDVGSIVPLSSTRCLIVGVSNNLSTLQDYTIKGYGEQMKLNSSTDVTDIPSGSSFKNPQSYSVSETRNFIIFTKWDTATSKFVLSGYDVSSTIHVKLTDSAVMTGFSTSYDEPPTIYFFKDSDRGLVIGNSSISSGSEVIAFSISSSGFTMGTNQSISNVAMNNGNISMSSTKFYTTGGYSNNGFLYEYTSTSDTTVTVNKIYTSKTLFKSLAIIGNINKGIIGIIYASQNNSNMNIQIFDINSGSIPTNEFMLNSPLFLYISSEKSFENSQSHIINSDGVCILQLFGSNSVSALRLPGAMIITLVDKLTAPTISYVPRIYNLPASADGTIDFLMYTGYVTKGFCDKDFTQFFKSETYCEYPVGKVISYGDGKTTYEQTHDVINGFTGLQPGFLYYLVNGELTTLVNPQGTFLGVAITTKTISKIPDPILNML